MDYTESNKLIAIFMDQKDKLKDSLEYGDFHLYWDWLMPVVEKIESLGYWFNIKKNHVTVAWDNKTTLDSKMIHSEFGDLSKIERVYSCVVEFIKYYNYNENKKEKEGENNSKKV